MIESNPIRILKTLDSFLKDRIELVVYGKAVLRLSFQADSSLGVTIDVDEVLEIAKRERLGHLLHRIAEDILSFGIELKNWSKMLESTKYRDFPIGVLPYRSRYIADQGNYVPEEECYQILKPSRVLDETAS